MAWANAFDLGVCTVKVMDSGTDAELFSQVMTKGDVATYNDTDLPGTITVAVSVDGEVSLSATTQFPTSSNPQRALRVVPSIAPTTNCRLSGITADIGVAGTSQAIGIGEYGNLGQYVGLSGDASGWTPDPCYLRVGAVEISMHAMP